MLGDVNKLFVIKSLLTMPSNVLTLHLKQTYFPPIIWIFIECEGEFRLPFEIFSTLPLIDIRHFLSCWDKTSLFTFWFSFLLTLLTFLINLLLQINLAKMRNRGSISLKLVAKLMVKAGFNHIITVDMHSKGTIHTIAFFNLIIF